MLISGSPFHGRVCAYHSVPVWQVIEVRAEAAYMAAAGLMEQLSLRRSERRGPGLCCAAGDLTGDRLRTVHLSLLVNE